MRRLLALLLVVSFVLGGCAASRSELDISIPMAEHVTASVGKEVYVGSIVDKRVFEFNPGTPDKPSLDPSREGGSEIIARAVGRKRSIYGKAMGDVLLREGQTVETLVAGTIRQALSDIGYKVLTDESQIKENTIIVTGVIRQFWTWFNPGPFSITLSALIETTLTVNPPKNGRTIPTIVLGHHSAAMALESTYAECIEQVLRLYAEDIKQQFK